jgi:hypothetical protein
MLSPAEPPHAVNATRKLISRLRWNGQTGAQANARRVYGRVLRRMPDEFRVGTGLDEISAAAAQEVQVRAGVRHRAEGPGVVPCGRP